MVAYWSVYGDLSPSLYIYIYIYILRVTLKLLSDGVAYIRMKPILLVIGRVLNSGELVTSIFLRSCARLSSKLCITRSTALINTVLSILDTVKSVKICVCSSISASVLRNGCYLYIEGCLVDNTVSDTVFIRRTVACVCLRMINTCHKSTH